MMDMTHSLIQSTLLILKLIFMLRKYQLNSSVSILFDFRIIESDVIREEIELHEIPEEKVTQ